VKPLLLAVQCIKSRVISVANFTIKASDHTTQTDCQEVFGGSIASTLTAMAGRIILGFELDRIHLV
jgi:hypothetical protein